VPHLLNLLSKKRIKAFLRFSEVRQRCNYRKELARHLHGEVAKLRSLPGIAQSARQAELRHLSTT